MDVIIILYVIQVHRDTVTVPMYLLPIYVTWEQIGFVTKGGDSWIMDDATNSVSFLTHTLSALTIRMIRDNRNLSALTNSP